MLRARTNPVFIFQCHNMLFQISDFNSAKADFGTELAISTRTELDPGDSNRTMNILNLYLSPIIKLSL